MSDVEWYADSVENGSNDADAAMSLTEYHVSAAPNDFNVRTIADFMESNVIQIPPFQRNYVWDQKRASRFIESIIMGLPIPQIFLYERARNEFQVIDGQQRLLSIYFFINGRFPLPKARAELRKRLGTAAIVPAELFNDDKLFSDFQITLPLETPGQKHPLEGMCFADLGEMRAQFHLRTIRVVIVKQTSPEGDDSIYEIFNRLNSGGVNLTSQEIRLSLYHSPFLDMLNECNGDKRWRKLLGLPKPDVHYRDVEFLLRGVALLTGGSHYRPSMARFLNTFARAAEKFDAKRVMYYRDLIRSFFNACHKLRANAFHGQTSKFTVSIFDAVFAAWCSTAYRGRVTAVKQLPGRSLAKLKSNKKFLEVAQARTTGIGNVRDRLRIAAKVLGSK